MATLGQVTINEHRELVRQQIVRNPNIAALTIAKNLSLDKDYVGKHVKKIRAERAKRINTQTIGVELARTEDLFNDLAMEAYKILKTAKHPSVRISAIRTLNTLAKDLLDIKFDAGVFERKLGEIKTVSFEGVLELIYDQRASKESDKIEG